jgi:hypothetical protein
LTKAFLRSLKIYDSSPVLKLFFEKFMDGYDLKVGPMNQTDELALKWAEVKQNLKDIYSW